MHIRVRNAVVAALLAAAALVAGPRRTEAAPPSLDDDGRVGVVADLQGTALVRPAGRQRWSPLGPRSVLLPGDEVRTMARGAHAAELRLADGGTLVLGPDALAVLESRGRLRLSRGEAEIAPAAGKPVVVTGPGGFESKLDATRVLRASDRATTALGAPPRWLTGYRGSTTDEWMGSLLAKVDGRNVPLSVGYHKVGVTIRDQVAETTVEESFVNSTDSTLEGVFTFPLPAGASVSGFGMWVGEEYVEADVVERDRARQIYEDIKARKKDPGLLEWSGGNLFTANVFPIFGHSEKRIRLRYTQVLPLEGAVMRYRYALRSELLRAHPVRELEIRVSAASAVPFKSASSPTHEVRAAVTGATATAEFRASQFSPDRDFEVVFGLEAASPLRVAAHRRGEDGYLMALFAPPDPSAGAWKRELVPEGRPLDLVLVADTSGSMGPGERRSQRAFLDALLSHLGPDDRFRLMACDAKVVWLDDAALAATPENAARALAFLDRRASLGWSDLESAFAAAAARAADGTIVVYVGDGVQTTGDADPVAFAKRLGNVPAPAGAAFHAVAPGSSWEQPVMDALAARGGSFRPAGDDAARAAYALLTEVAQPPVKDLRVAFEGIRTARVYPERLPNAAAGTQQIVLGRFLPEGGAAQRGRVNVTGTLDGKPVSWTADVVVEPGAEGEGNTFLPRLWARRHLDALLAEGRTPAIKEEIVSMSERFGIVTPYTSLLVLESDEDRERYGVARRVAMRDGERFFTEARSAAATEALRAGMRTARSWRLGLRRRMLAEIARLGRGIALAEPGGAAVPGEVFGIGGGAGGTFTGGGRRGYRGPQGEATVDFDTESRDEPLLREAKLEDHNESEGDKAGDGAWAGESGLDGGEVPPDSREPSDPPEPAGDPAPAPAPAALPVQERAKSLADSRGDDEMAEESLADSGVDLSGLVEGNEVLRKSASVAFEIAARVRAGGGSGPARASGKPVSGAQPWMAQILFQQFPGLDVPADPAPPPPNTWDEATAAVLAAVSGDANLTLAADARLDLTWSAGAPDDEEGFWPSQTGRALVSPAAWSATSRSAGAEPVAQWLSGDRGVLSTGVRLGRKRLGTGRDRGAWTGHVALFAYDFVRSHAAWAARTDSREGAVVVVTLTAPGAAKNELVVTIDTDRRVVLRWEWRTDGKTTSTVAADGFVRAGGVWWPGTETHTDPDGRVTWRKVRTVREVPAAEFDAALAASVAGHEDVVFLGAADPPLAAAKEAVHAGRATFADHLAVAGEHVGFQRWDDAWAAWEKARALAETPAAPKPGLAWIDVALAAVSRRGEAASAKVGALAAAVAARGGPAAHGLARKLDSVASGVLGAGERLTLLDVLEPAGDAAASAEEKRWQTDHWRHVRAAVLQQAGRFPESVEIHRALWSERPKSLQRAVHLMNDLAGSGDADGVLALLGKVEPSSTPMNAHLVQSLFSTAVRALGNAGRFADVLGVTDRWSQADPARQEPHSARLRALLALSRIDEFDAWIRREVESPKLPGKDAAARARLGAAIEMALGNEWNPYWSEPWWGGTSDPVWTQPLGVLARRLTREEGGDVAAATWIVSHGRWNGTESHRRLLDRLREDLVAPGGVETPKPADLATILGWTRWDRESVDAAVFRGVADRVKARWRAAKTDEDRAPLLGALVAMLDAHLEPDETLAVLREALAAAPADRVPGFAWQILARLGRGPWTPELENECFALVPKLVTEKDAPVAQRTVFASAARWLESRMTPLRTEAGLPPVVEREKLPRAELRLRQRAARDAARRGFAARLATESRTASAPFRPWLEIERLCLLAEAGDDAATIEAEARELLLSLPQPSVTATDDAGAALRAQDEYLSDVLRERCVLVLSSLAVRRNAPAGLADRVLALLADRMAKEPGTLDWRTQTFRLLVALDRPQELEAALRSWIVPAEVESRWRRALGWLLAELSRVREAAGQFEEIAKLDELGPPEWAALADWYLVLGEDARRETALERRYDRTNEWVLQNRIYAEQNRLRGGADGVPQSLDDEVLRVIRVYMTKASYPGNAVWPIRNLYEATKDFRVLAPLADAVVGHTPESVYGFLGQAAQFVENVHEEATCDEIRKRILERIATARTDTDRRALSLLLAVVERRASEVLDQRGPHASRALEHLRAARRGTWLPGERRLMADYLAGLGKVPDAAFAAEQLGQLRDLHGQETAGTPDRLHVAFALFRTEWAYERRDAAIDGLAAALEERRRATGGRLTADVHGHADTLAGWYEAASRFGAGEAWLAAEAERQPAGAARQWFERRIFRTWVACQEAGGTVSLGTGEALYRAARERIGKALFSHAPDDSDEVLQSYCELHRAAHRRKAAKTVAADLVAASRGILAESESRQPRRATQHAGVVAQALRDVAGPLPALTYLVERIEREPEWIARRGRGQGSWGAHAWVLGKWREEAGRLGDVEPRLLAIVLRELERDLLTEQSVNRQVYGRHQHFWSEKAGDFATVARRVIETNPDSPGRLRHAAEYLWGDLELRDEAIRTLEAAGTRGMLREDGRVTLVVWLQELERWKESLPHAERLVTEKPDVLDFRLRRIRALHHVGRGADGRAGVEAAVAHFTELRKRRRVGPYHGALADVAVEGGWTDLAAALYPDAISERRKATRGRADSELSRLYGGLARALSGLGRHDDALDAASSGVVIWGGNQDGRAQALAVVREVLEKIPDLAAWAAKWEADVAQTGLDAPVLRLALADVHLSRNEPDAALRHLLAARRVTPDDANVHAQVARAYEMKGDGAGRADALATSLHHVPRQPQVYGVLADLCASIGRADDAERALTSLAEYAPNEPEGHRLLAERRAAANRHADAAEQWRQVVRTRPREMPGWAELARSLVRAGKADEARAALGDALRTPWGAEQREAFEALVREVGGQ